MRGEIFETAPYWAGVVSVRLGAIAEKKVNQHSCLGFSVGLTTGPLFVSYGGQSLFKQLSFAPFIKVHFILLVVIAIRIPTCARMRVLLVPLLLLQLNLLYLIRLFSCFWAC